MTRNETTPRGMAGQTVYTLGYEYAQAAAYHQGMTDFPESPVEVLRPSQYALDHASTRSYDPYTLPDLIPDAFNLDIFSKEALRGFVNQYGLLSDIECVTDTGMIYKSKNLADGSIQITWEGDKKPRRKIFEDTLNGRFVFHRGDVVHEVLHQLRTLQLCYEISNTLFDEVKEDIEVERALKEFCEITVTSRGSQESERIMVKSERFGTFYMEYFGSRGYSSNQTVDNAFYFLAGMTENALAVQSFSTLHFPEQTEGRASIRRVRYSKTLLGLLWAFVSDSIGNGGHMRRCANCGKWFRYEKFNARVCSSACRQAISRRNRKATA